MKRRGWQDALSTYSYSIHFVFRTSWKWEYEEERMAGHYHAITILTFNLVGNLFFG